MIIINDLNTKKKESLIICGICWKECKIWNFFFFMIVNCSLFYHFIEIYYLSDLSLLVFAYRS